MTVINPSAGMDGLSARDRCSASAEERTLERLNPRRHGSHESVADDAGFAKLANQKPGAGDGFIGSLKLGVALILIVLGRSATVVADGEPIATHESPSIDETANQLADEVFAAEEFWWKRTERVESPSFLGRIFSALYQSLIRPILRALGDLIKTIFEWLMSLSGFGAGGDWSSGIPLLWVVVLLLGGIVVWRVVVILRSQRAAPPLKHQDPAVHELPHAEQLLEQAQDALSRGDRRNAIRLAFLALIAHLQDIGKLSYDPSRSNREYQRDLRPWPDLSSGFRACAEPFERCWYGGANPESAEVDDLISRCRSQLLVTTGDG